MRTEADRPGAGGGWTRGADRLACRKQQPSGQMSGGRGPGLGVVRGLEPGGSWPGQPTLHPRSLGSRQVGGLLWILLPAPEGVRSQ